MTEQHRYTVILAGGSGQRLWPLSRERRPKQLIPVLEGKSLLEAAYARVEGVVPVSLRWVCAGASWEPMIREKIPSLSKFIGEPTGRDTLAAIALSCAHAYAADHEAIVAFLTSDHVIRPVSAFAKALSHAFELVERDASLLVTFGVVPTFSATAYGYLELGEQIGEGVSRVRRFKEKPDRATAERYCDEGPKAYLWNSGMFVWSAKRFLELLARYELEIARAIAYISSAIASSEYEARLADIYPNVKKKSVDYGIMEPASLDHEVRI
jgi:mannose-1-phosphate guanylyltransferase